MGRFFLTVLLGLAGFAGIMWYFGLMPGGEQAEGTPKKLTPGGIVETDLGDPLYPPLKREVKLRPEEMRGAPRIDPVVIGGQLSGVDKVVLAPEVDGTVLFVGEELSDAVVAATGVAPFLADPYRFAVIDLGRPSTSEGELQGNRVVYKIYRRLEDGMTVAQDQVVAMINPAKAISELAIRRAKLSAAVADLRATQFLLKEATLTVKTDEPLYARGGISKEELRRSQLTRDKYYEESTAKEQAINVAASELQVAEYQLKEHEIRNRIRLPYSKIKTIHKNSGDPVKASEPIIELVSNNYLIAEGMIDIQYAQRLRKPRRVILEPTQEEEPLQKLQAHHGEITAVAVARDGKFLSASEDKTVCLWDRSRSRPLRQLEHAEPVRAIACTPAGAKGNWCAAGCADGSIHLWDLDKSDDKPAAILHKHGDAITALAFSPNGQWLASGGADNLICMWRLDGDPEKSDSFLQYPFDAKHGVDANDAHHGPVTALHFTPQTRLVSAGRDATIRVWELREKGAKLERRKEGRGVTVSQLGVDRAGKWMIYDKMGKELHILSVDDGRYVCSLQNPHGAIPFETLAVFSPDEQASLLLTAGAAEGRLQMWRTPSEQERGFEVRQLVPPEKAAVTCAAFSHNSAAQAEDPDAFVVSGSKAGYVYVWRVPSRRQVADHQIVVNQQLIVAPSQDSTRQARVHVGLRNPEDPEHPDGRLIPGRPVTIVIE